MSPQEQAAREIAYRILPCWCHASYKDRGLAQPDCPRHNFAEEIVDALAASAAKAEQAQNVVESIAVATAYEGSLPGSLVGHVVILVKEVLALTAKLQASERALERAQVVRGAARLYVLARAIVDAGLDDDALSPDQIGAMTRDMNERLTDLDAAVDADNKVAE